MKKKMIISLSLMLAAVLFLGFHARISDFVCEKFGREYTFSVNFTGIDEETYYNDELEQDEEHYPLYYRADYTAEDELPFPIEEFIFVYGKNCTLRAYMEKGYFNGSPTYTVNGQIELSDRELAKEIYEKNAEENSFLLLSSPDRWFKKAVEGHPLTITVNALGSMMRIKSFSVEGKSPDEFFREISEKSQPN